MLKGLFDLWIRETRRYGERDFEHSKMAPHFAVSLRPVYRRMQRFYPFAEEQSLNEVVMYSSLFEMYVPELF